MGRKEQNTGRLPEEWAIEARKAFALSIDGDMAWETHRHFLRTARLKVMLDVDRLMPRPDTTSRTKRAVSGSRDEWGMLWWLDEQHGRGRAILMDIGMVWYNIWHSQSWL